MVVVEGDAAAWRPRLVVPSPYTLGLHNATTAEAHDHKKASYSALDKHQYWDMSCMYNGKEHYKHKAGVKEVEDSATRVQTQDKVACHS